MVAQEVVKMLVWEKIADHTSMKSIDDVANWLTRYEIKACDIENVVGYVGKGICCNKDCSKCLYRYLGIDLEIKGFIEITDENGQKQLMFGREFYE